MGLTEIFRMSNTKSIQCQNLAAEKIDGEILATLRVDYKQILLKSKKVRSKPILKVLHRVTRA